MSRVDATKTTTYKSKPVKELKTRAELAYSNDTVTIDCKLTVKSEREKVDLRKAIEFLQLLLEQEHGF